MQDDAPWYEAAQVVGITNALNVVADALEGTTTGLLTPLDEATAELERTRTENRAGQLALPRRHPSFAEFADEYLGNAIPMH